MYTAIEKLWLTEERDRVVKDGDPAAAFLLVPVGGQLSNADAEKYGLLSAKVEPPVADDSAKANSAPAENKANSAPAENKGVQFPPQAKRK